MLDDSIELAKDTMEKAKDRLARELGRIRAGRASPTVLEDVKVENYGTMMPLNQVSNITVADARLLVVKPWDRNLVPIIERAITNAGLGLNPNNDGVIVRVPIPPLTEERRKVLCKQVREAGEEAKIAIRSGRRDANDLLKQAEKDKEISKDDLERGLEKIQTLTDKFVKEIDSALEKKEAEILQE
jgi:ribosome recycling factor